jgi:hypothetical protein
VDEPRDLEETLQELARRIEARPWNQPGTDKSWVLRTMARGSTFRGELKRRVRSR